MSFRSMYQVFKGYELLRPRRQPRVIELNVSPKDEEEEELSPKVRPEDTAAATATAAAAAVVALEEGQQR